MSFMSLKDWNAEEWFNIVFCSIATVLLLNIPSVSLQSELEKKCSQEHTLPLQLKKYITFPNVLRIDFDIFKLQNSNII